MPPGQRCSVCREQGHNRVTCVVAQRRRDEELGKLRQQVQRLRGLLRTAFRSGERERSRADEAERQAADAEWRESDAAWRADAAESRAEASARRADNLAWELDESARAASELEMALCQAENQVRWLEDEREQMYAAIEAAQRDAAEQGLRADVNEAMATGYEAELEALKRELVRLRAAANSASK